MKDIPEVNKKLQPIIEALEINQENPGDGYNAKRNKKRFSMYRK